MAEEKKEEVKNGGKEGKSLNKKNNKIKELEAALEEKDKALEKEKNDYLLLMAEFENFRRRSAAERLSLVSTASEDMIVKLLPVVDDFERALKAMGEAGEGGSAKEGCELIYNKLMAILKAKGLSVMEVKDQPFDAESMEAVAQFPAPDESGKGKVFDVVQNGYRLGEKIIRYAKVVVGQ